MNFSDPITQDLFGPTKKYTVPKYQRGYAWKDKVQINDFWEDLQQVNKDNKLFLGTLILHKTDRQNEFEIIDGQQRLTTLSLFFIACRNLAIEKNFPQASHLPSLVASHNIARGDVLVPKLSAGSNISEAFQYLVENHNYKGGVFPKNIDGRKARILKANYNFFYGRISQFSEKELGDLLENTLENSFFLQVVVEDAMQAFDIFERTNARGIPLNIADLLKNLLFANETEINDLTARWDYIVETLDTRLSRLLKYFDSLSNGHDTGKTVLFAHLRESVKLMKPSVFMNEIEAFAFFYRDSLCHNLNRETFKDSAIGTDFDELFFDEIFLKRLQRSVNALNLAGVQVQIPIVYSGLKALVRFSEDKKKLLKLKSEYIKLVNSIECFHFINNGIATSPTNKPEQIYAVHAKKIFEAESPDEVIKSFRQVAEGLKKIGLADKSTFVEQFSQIVYSPQSNKPLIAYIFDCFEHSPYEKTPSIALYEPTTDKVVNRKYEVEHIASRSTWVGDEDTLNSIGNLLIVTHSLNRKVGNKKVTEKIKFYKDAKYDKLSSVENFVSWYRDQKVKDLTEKEIFERAEYLANLAYEKVWCPEW